MSYKVIHIGITRTGSGSIESILKQNWNRNSTSKQIRDIIGEKEWKNSFKFAFVRHPIDRFISAFTSQSLHLDNRKRVTGYIKDVLDKAKSGVGGYILFIPMVDFLTEEIDFIGKYENKEDWEKIEEKIGKIPHQNKNPTDKDFKLNEEEEKMVREFYKEDFKRFNYK